ncbi:MAG: FISUMP domain-containing protein [Bacteroidales bacterium]
MNRILVIIGLMFLVSANNLIHSQQKVGKIIFTSTESGNSDIWAMDLTGENKVQLTTDASYDQLPLISPDHKKILFISGRSGGPQMWIMNLDGSNQFQLWDDPGYNHQRASWSPDGTSIYFSRGSSGGGCAPCPTYEIWKINADGTDPLRITNDSYRDHSPFLSPDGQKITFTKAKNAGDCCGATDLCTMNLDGSNMQRISVESGYSWGDCGWSPDGNRILYGISVSGVWYLYSIDSDGSNKTLITDHAYYARYSSDGMKILYSNYNGESSNDFCLINHDGTEKDTLISIASLGQGFDWFEINTNIDSSLVAWYPLDGNANDSSGNGLNGINKGSSCATDRFGNPNSSMEFDGISDYIDLGKSLDFDSCSNQSISLWVKLYSTNGNNGGRIFISHGDGGQYPFTQFFLGISNTDNKLIQWVRYHENEFNINLSQNPINLNSWLHIVSVKDVYGKLILYINGVKSNEYAGIPGFHTPPNTAKSFIGAMWATGGMNNGILNSMHGCIDDVRVYRKELDSLEILALFHEKDWPNNAPFIDIDGNTYDTVHIGTQIWIKQNLKVTHYSNGDHIPNVTNNTIWPSLTSGARCYYSNDSAIMSPEYGALYNWFAVNDTGRICPSGWHVATDQDFEILENFLGGWENAGKKLKEAGFTHWSTDNSEATNESNFTALPGGYRNVPVAYLNKGHYAHFWSSTYASESGAWYRWLPSETNEVLRYAGGKVLGMSVRCVKDPTPSLVLKIIHPSQFNTNSILVSGEILDSGNLSIITSGFCWSKSPNPTIKDSLISNYGFIKKFTNYIGNLLPNTQYFIRAWAINATDTGYSDTLSFITLPAVTGTAPSAITATSASCTAAISGGSASTILSRGVCWSTHSESSIADSVLYSGSGMGNFTAVLKNLRANTTFYLRAFATNSTGISYGEEFIFKTKRPDLALRWISPDATPFCGTGNEETITIRIVNKGDISVSQVPVAFSVNGGGSWTSEMAQVQIAAGDSATYSFKQKAALGTAGTYSCLAFVSLPADVVSSNDTARITVTNSPMLVTAKGYDTYCRMTTGAAEVISVSGGTAPFHYLWTTGDTTIAIDQVPSGKYKVSVTDVRGCKSSAMVNILASGGPNASAGTVVNQLSCFGGKDGSVVLSVLGGTKPYKYAWSNGDTVKDLVNVMAGTYDVTITDAAGCENTYSYNLTEPPVINLSLTSEDALCGLSAGSTSVQVTGGTSPYTFLWSTGNTTPSVSQLPGGMYSVTVKDSKNCQASGYITINEVGGPVISTNLIIPAQCGESSGSIDISVSGGNGNYTYLWSDGSEMEDLQLAAPGNYTVAVRHSGDICKTTQVFTIPSVKPDPWSICIVSVDSLTNQNNIVWEKPVEQGSIRSFVVYKETSRDNEFMPIGEVKFSDPSEFLDVLSNTLRQPWTYKISVKDSCGNESPLSAEHSTIHLSVSPGIGSNEFNLFWNNYDGIGIVSTYRIFRYSENVGWSLLQEYAARPYLNTYTDSEAPESGGLFYVVETDLPYECNTGKKGKSRNTVRSNKGTARSLTTGFGNPDGGSNLQVFPNPSNGLLTILLRNIEPSDYLLRVVDVNGRTMMNNMLQINGVDEQIQLDLQFLAPGVYQIQLIGSNEMMNRTIIIR